MATKSFKRIAKKSGKSVADMDRYYKRAKKATAKQKAKGKKIKDENAYNMAITLRQAQRTGNKPHKPLGKKKKKKTTKEAFEIRVDQILESAFDMRCRDADRMQVLEANDVDDYDVEQLARMGIWN